MKNSIFALVITLAACGGGALYESALDEPPCDEPTAEPTPTATETPAPTEAPTTTPVEETPSPTPEESPTATPPDDDDSDSSSDDLSNDEDCDSDDTCKRTKKWLCHVPPGNPDKSISLYLPQVAVYHHLNNHPDDYLGKCIDSCKKVE